MKLVAIGLRPIREKWGKLQNAEKRSGEQSEAGVGLTLRDQKHPQNSGSFAQRQTDHHQNDELGRFVGSGNQEPADDCRQNDPNHAEESNGRERRIGRIRAKQDSFPESELKDDHAVQYREPDAPKNYRLMLGWSHGSIG